jgi:hypothetical protein
LLALLLLVNSYLPKLPDAEQTSVDLPLIRIQTEHKWPERIVYDTRHPIVVPALSERAQAGVAPPAATANVPASAREAFAQAPPSDAGKVQSADQKKPQAKRRVARRRAPPVLMVARQPQFAWFGPRFW